MLTATEKTRKILNIEIDVMNRTIGIRFRTRKEDGRYETESMTRRYTKVSVGGHVIAALVKLLDNADKIDRGVYTK